MGRTTCPVVTPRMLDVVHSRGRCASAKRRMWAFGIRKAIQLLRVDAQGAIAELAHICNNGGYSLVDLGELECAALLQPRDHPLRDCLVAAECSYQFHGVPLANAS